jgi:hypothetical protein
LSKFTNLLHFKNVVGLNHFKPKTQKTMQEVKPIIRTYTKKELMNVLECTKYKTLNKYLRDLGILKPAMGRRYSPKQVRTIFEHHGIV